MCNGALAKDIGLRICIPSISQLCAFIAARALFGSRCGDTRCCSIATVGLNIPMLVEFYINGHVALAVTCTTDNFLFAICAFDRDVLAGLHISFHTPNIFGLRCLHVERRECCIIMFITRCGTALHFAVGHFIQRHTCFNAPRIGGNTANASRRIGL